MIVFGLNYFVNESKHSDKNISLNYLLQLMSSDIIHRAEKGLEILIQAMESIQWIGGFSQQKDVFRYVYVSLCAYKQLKHILVDTCIIDKKIEEFREKLAANVIQNKNNNIHTWISELLE